MISHLPILPVLLPLLAAPLGLLLRSGRAAWVLALAAAWSAFAVCVLLLRQVLAGGTVSYALGSWPAPWGIEYRIDLASAFVLIIVSGIGALVVPYARRSVVREIAPVQVPLFYTALMLCLAGLLGITATGDAFNLFVFLEISSLSSYVLIAMGRDRRALTSAYQYLVMGTIGATFILIGVGLLYMMTGTLNMQDLAARLPELAGARTVRVAFGFLTVGISLKLALFPLHLWLPNAYTYAPSVVSAFMAATATKVAAYVLLRFVFTIFGAEFCFRVMPLGGVLMVLAVLAVLIASTVAAAQDNLKRMLAYSSVAQIGYVMLGVAMATATGLTAALLHLFNHALIKAALFLALGSMAYRMGPVHLTDARGLGRRMPWTMAAFVGGGLSLIGIPFTVGFISKWYLVLAALEAGLWPVAGVILAGSLIALVYVWRVVEAAYFLPAGDGPKVREAPFSLLLPTWLLVLANLYFGLDTGLTVGTARQAARVLMEGG